MEKTAMHGTVDHNGRELTLTQQPYYEKRYGNCCDYERYWAIGVDARGEEYEISWKITREDCEEEDACDWTKFRVRKL